MSTTPQLPNNDNLALELESFKMRNAQRSLPEYELSTEVNFSPRPRFTSTGPVKLPRTTESLVDETPVLADLVVELTNKNVHQTLGSYRPAEQQEPAEQNSNELIKPIYDSEIKIGKISAVTSLVCVIIAVLVALLAFGSVFAHTLDPLGLASKIISLIALIAISYLALRSSQRSRENAQRILLAGHTPSQQ